MDAPHNYNQYTREHVYAWFMRWLNGDSSGRLTIPEDPIPPPPAEILLHSGSPVKPTHKTTARQLEQICPRYCADALPSFKNRQELADFHKKRLPVLSETLNNDLELKDIVVRSGIFAQWRLPRARAIGQILSRREVGDVIPAVRVLPDEVLPGAPAFLLLAPKGKDAFFNNSPYAPVLDLLCRHRCPCLAIDLLGSGETAAMQANSLRDENLPDFFAFNPSLFSMRVQDILTSLALLREEGHKDIVVIAMGEAARAAACALPLAAPVKAAVLNLGGVYDTPQAWLNTLSFQPMAFKFGGIKGALALQAPQKLLLFQAPQDVQTAMKSCYAAAGRPRSLIISDDNLLALLEQVLP